MVVRSQAVTVGGSCLNVNTALKGPFLCEVAGAQRTRTAPLGSEALGGTVYLELLV